MVYNRCTTGSSYEEKKLPLSSLFTSCWNQASNSVYVERDGTKYAVAWKFVC